MKKQLWMATIVVLAGIAACNYTVGDCWPVGQGDSTGDVGSGVINSTGPGNPGEGPTSEAKGALTGAQCNDPVDDGTTELGEVKCSKAERGPGCMARCGKEAEVFCPSGMPHPKKADGGQGLLWKCCGCQGQQQCKYIYDNGDSCTWFLASWTKEAAVCIYQGGI